MTSSSMNMAILNALQGLCILYLGAGLGALFYQRLFVGMAQQYVLGWSIEKRRDVQG